MTQIAARKSNWGRWGAEDERGTANLLVQDAVLRGIRAARSGRVYSLGLPLDQDTVHTASRSPMWHIAMPRPRRGPGGRGSADDMIVMYTHYGTHIDALCHHWADNKFYNGFGADVVTSRGADRLSIDHVPWLAGRGVLLDVAGFRGVEHLQSGQPIFPDELEACARAENITFQPGDTLLIHTGWMKTSTTDRGMFLWGEPGPAEPVADWFGEHDFVALGADNWGVEAVPPQNPKGGMKLHERILRDYGGYLMENLYLEELARDKVYEFLFVVAPLKITKGLGSPINPLALA